MSEQRALPNQGLEIERKILIAESENLALLQALIPYLIYRQQAAKAYFKATEIDKKNYWDYVDSCNEHIKAILGL